MKRIVLSFICITLLMSLVFAVPTFAGKGGGTTPPPAPVKHKIIVSKDGAGDFTDPVSAMNSITDASANNLYLIQINPGNYTLAYPLQMSPYVDIEGSGEGVTRIVGSVTGASNAEIRMLTVQNPGNGVAISNITASPRILKVTAISSGSETGVIVNASGSSTLMTDVKIISTGGYIARGLGNYYSSPTMNNVSISVSNGYENTGIFNNNSALTMSNSAITVTGGTFTYGVLTGGQGIPVNMANSVIVASGASYGNTGIQGGGLINLTNLIIDVFYTPENSNNENGILCTENSSFITINNSVIKGRSSTIQSGGSNSVAKVGNTQLAGGAVIGPNVTCAGVYDENYTFYANTCP